MNKAYVIKIIDTRGKAWFYTRFNLRAMLRYPIQTIHYGISVSNLSDAKLYKSKGKALIRARKVKKICESRNSNTIIVAEIRSESNDKS